MDMRLTGSCKHRLLASAASALALGAFAPQAALAQDETVAEETE